MRAGGGAMRFVVDENNRELERLFQDNFEEIVKALETCDFIELDRTALICHR